MSERQYLVNEATDNEQSLPYNLNQANPKGAGLVDYQHTAASASPAPGVASVVMGRLFMLSGNQQGREYRLTTPITTLGRAIHNDIVIADRQTSRRHLQIVRENNLYQAHDAGSANGFYVNEQRVTHARLNHGDVITIGAVRIAFYLDNAIIPSGSAVQANGQPHSAPVDETALAYISLRTQPVTTIGREYEINMVVLDNPQVSRRHLQVMQQNGNFVLRDLRSTNGTFVNGALVTTDTLLNDGDLVNIGPFCFMFAHGAFSRSFDDDSVRVDVLNLGKTLNNNTRILQNITFTILPREFVAIVGGSGAGKSTLLDAVSGVRPATAGTVLYNKADYYRRIDMYRSAIGYVPQQDIVPVELSVQQALYYAARLRLPQDTTAREIAERLEEVLEDLDLTEKRAVPIRLLSGGQRKRVSIGAELISKPSLFFLDEPTSGLDPGLEARMMRLLRKLADQGRTVILITHATQNLQLCDQVLFLARGGQVAFYGAPAEALTYFGVSNFADIYVKLEQERSSQEWTTAFQTSVYYNKNVATRLKAIAAEAMHYGISLEANQVKYVGPAVAVRPPLTFRRPVTRLGAWRQFKLLTQRYFETLIKDPKNLLILLLQAPIIALLLLVGFKRAAFNLENGDFGAAKTLVFLLTIIAVWFGTNNAAREIVKEAAIYKRERDIGLKLAPYLISKLVVQFGLMLVQVAVLLGLTWLGLGLGGPSIPTLASLFVTLLLVAFSGTTLGLLLSAINKNSDRVTSTVPIILIPQIIFGGAIISLDKMGLVGNWLGDVMVSNWGYRALGTLINLDKIPSPKVEVENLSSLLPPEQATSISQATGGSVTYDNGNWFIRPSHQLEFGTSLAQDWFMLVALSVVAIALIVIFQLRKDKDYSR